MKLKHAISLGHPVNYALPISLRISRQYRSLKMIVVKALSHVRDGTSDTPPYSFRNCSAPIEQLLASRVHTHALFRARPTDQPAKRAQGNLLQEWTKAKARTRKETLSFLSKARAPLLGAIFSFLWKATILLPPPELFEKTLSSLLLFRYA